MLVVGQSQLLVFLQPLFLLPQRVVACHGRWCLDGGAIFALDLSHLFRHLFFFLLKV